MAEIETAEDLIKGLFAIVFLTIIFFLGYREIWRTHFASDRCRESFCSKKAQQDSKYCHSCRNQKTRDEKQKRKQKLLESTSTNNSNYSHISCRNCGKKLAQKDSFGKTVAKKTGGTGAGFALGATIGTIVLPGWGTVIGAGLGAKEGFDVSKQTVICDSCQPLDYTYQSRCSLCSRSDCNGCGDEF